MEYYPVFLSGEVLLRVEIVHVKQIAIVIDTYKSFIYKSMGFKGHTSIAIDSLVTKS